MKNIVLGLLILGLTSVANAQQKTQEKSASSDPITNPLNSSYLKEVNTGMYSQVVYDMESLAARYDITKDAVYLPGAQTTYELRIGNGNNEIKAVYDQDGTLISSNENYSNIVLPLALRISIAKKYPGWAFYANNYNLRYVLNEDIRRTCTIFLEKDDRMMHFTLDLSRSKFEGDLAGVAYGN